MGIKFTFKQTNLKKWPLQKSKQFKVSSTKSGIPTMLTSQALSIRKRPRNSSKTPLVTSDPVTNSPKRPSMRSSKLSTRTTQEPSRRPRWLSSSSNSLMETEQAKADFRKNQEREARIGSETSNSSGWVMLAPHEFVPLTNIRALSY